MATVGEVIPESELLGSDLKIKEIAPERFDLVATRNGDIDVVEGQLYIVQRVVHVIFTRCRFYPPQVPSLIEANETLQQNVDEIGRSFFPGDLEELGYPEYGSILPHLIGEPNTPQLKVLMMLYISQAVSLEYENGVEEITRLEIIDLEGDFLINLGIRLINNKSVTVTQRVVYNK